MSIDTGNLLEPTNVRKPGDFYRNHQGAPYVTHPTETKKDGSPKRVVYGRPSSFGSALDNAYNLVKWKERQLLIGMDVLIDDGLEFPNDPPDRDWLDGLAARCHQAAGSSLAADRGTHIHLLCERIDRNQDWVDLYLAGEELGIPTSLQQHIMGRWISFRQKLGVAALAVEATIVHDGWRLAGTLDRLDICDRDILTGFGIIAAGQSFIGDIKTGSLTLGRDGQPNYWVKYPVQLAAYAGGERYNVDTDQREGWCGQPYPQQGIALIYHYDLAAALEGVATDWQAIPVNLQAGREGGDLCRLAADFSKRRDLFLMPTPKIGAEPALYGSTGVDALAVAGVTGASPTTPATAPSHLEAAPGVEPTTGPAPATPGPVVDDFHIVVSDGRRGSVTVPTSRGEITHKIKRLAANGHEQVIRAEWPQGVPPLTDTSHTVEQLTQLFHMVRRVETEVGAPFDPEPAPLTPEQQAASKMLEDGFNGYTDAAFAAPLDDGAFLDSGEVELLKARMLALPDTRHIQLADISREANAAGRPISVTQKPCVRRWEIARALVLWAESDADRADLFALVASIATQEQVEGQQTIGAVLSQFTIEQAVELAHVYDIAHQLTI